MLLGCIGDDFTGSSDLANTLARGGMRTVQFCGLPGSPADRGIEAGVVALKTRTIPAAEAVGRSLAALDWLRAQGCRQYLFKYCSTFDSTPEGNIGPVLDALVDALGAETAVVCPAYPSLGRSVHQGHLFVGDRLLSESGMERHPLTPMTDPDIRRWLARQSRLTVGHVPAAAVLTGREAIRAAIVDQAGRGARLLVTDTLRDADLVEIGAALADAVLLSGGSGIALHLPENFRIDLSGSGSDWQAQIGPCAIISGSCSTATRAQVALHRQSHPALEVDADTAMAGRIDAGAAADWVRARLAENQAALPLVYSSTDPETVAAAQSRHGKDRVASAIEALLGGTARLLANGGVTRIVSAGGETSGAVVEALEVDRLEIGPEIAPGVPAVSVPGRRLALALKSGNFGQPDFFARAAAALGRP